MRFRRLAIMLALAACCAFGPAAKAQTADLKTPRAFVFIPLAANDRSFSQAAFEGYRALRDDGYRIAYRANVDGLKRAETLSIVDRQHGAGGRAFIFVGDEMTPIANIAAKRYPDAHVATVSGTASGPNVINYCLDCRDVGGRLAGRVAAQLTKTGEVGFVGGVSAVDGGEARMFRRTAKAHGAQALVSWTQDWSDDLAARKLTREQIRAGADVIYATVSAAPIRAAERYPDVKVIAALVDLSGASKSVAASVVIRLDVVYRRFLHSIRDGAFRPGNYEAREGDGIWEVVRPR